LRGTCATIAWRRARTAEATNPIHKLQIFMLGTERMWDTCAVELRVQLPRAVAVEIEEVQRRDPEVLSRILMYGLTRRAIFEQLARADWVAGER